MPECYICAAKRGRLAALILWRRHRDGCGTWYCSRCWATALPAEYETDEYTQLIRRQCRKCELWMEEIHTFRDREF